MFNEQTNASMEIKQTVDSSVEDTVFENPYVQDTQPEEQGPYTAEINLDPGMPEPVILYRSKEGIQRWLDETRVGQLLAQTKNVEYNDEFVKNNEKEIKEYFEKQPQGKEVTTVFEIIEPGDSINHQTVISASREDGIELDYFGRRTHLKNEMEIFSILIKEEIEEWKNQLRQLDIHNIFSKDDDDLVSLYRTLELLCMEVDMEQCEGLYTASTDRLTVMLAAVMAMSLKKPIYVDQSNKKVVAISADYSDKDNIKPNNNEILYHVSLTNRNNLQVEEKDRVVLC